MIPRTQRARFGLFFAALLAANSAFYFWQLGFSREAFAWSFGVPACGTAIWGVLQLTIRWIGRGDPE